MVSAKPLKRFFAFYRTALRGGKRSGSIVRLKHTLPLLCSQLDSTAYGSRIASDFSCITPSLSVLNTAHNSNDKSPVTLYSYNSPLCGSTGGTKPIISSESASRLAGSVLFVCQYSTI